MDTSTEEQQATQHQQRQGNLEELQTKLKDPATDFTQRDAQGRSLLHQAVLAHADPQLVKDLSDRVDLALRDVDGQTAVDLVPEDGSDDVLREVLEGKVKDMVLRGGEAGEKEAERLMLAGWSRWRVTEEEAEEKEVVQVWRKLLELKDQVEKVHKAVQEDRQEDVREQLTAAPSPQLLLTAADQTGLRPLHKAVLRRQGELLKFLAGSTFAESLNVTDHMGRTALHLAAAMTQDPQLYQALKDAGADDTIQDLAGKTPADYQQSPDSLPMADLMKRLEGTATSSASADAAADGDDNNKPDDSNAATTGEEAAPAQQVPQEDSQMTVPPEPQPCLPRNPTPPKEPSKPVEVKPVAMYVSSAGPERDRAPPPSTVDGRYVAQHLGSALALALADIVEKKPWDPVEYLAHWLYKYRRTMDEQEKQKALLEEIRAEEAAANEEEIIKFKRREERKRIQEEERVKREEEEAARKKREQEEMQRQAKEALLAQKPQLPTVREEEGEDAMMRERDENGQTELHLLAAQSGADLVAVMNLGYSLADRDANNKTARDIAEEQGLSENVETIDNYVSNLLEQEKLDTLRQLLVEGYDKLDAVLSTVSTEGLPLAVTDFVNAVPQLQDQAGAVLKAVTEGQSPEEVERAVEEGGKGMAMARDVFGRTPLHLALLTGRHDVVTTLVDRFPIALKARDNLNRTPLHYAAALSEEMTDFLKEKGADTNAKDAKQHVPAFYKDQKENILQMKSTLPSSTQESGEISLSVPQITTNDNNDNAQADDSQAKEETGQQEGEQKSDETSRKEAVLATTSAEQEEPSNE